MNPPDDDYVLAVCKMGQGAECCRYLTMSPDGWSCAKLTPLAMVIDAKIARSEMTARGDNCAGRGSV